jgi:hypothetical protein
MTCDGKKGKICKKIFAWFVWICVIKEFPCEIKYVARKENFAWFARPKKKEVPFNNDVWRQERKDLQENICVICVNLCD